MLLFLFCYFGFSISKVCGFVILPDEFGYWTYAARLQGYDWSDFTSLSSYYSYGYSLLLCPFLWLFHDSILAYRMAVSLNFAFLIMDFFLLNFLIKKVGNTDKRLANLFSAITVLYPGWLYYAKTTMVEVVLASCYLLLIVILYKFLNTKKNVFLIPLVLISVYLHFLHMRAVGTVIAIIISLLLYSWKNKKQFVYIILSVLVMCVLLSIGMKMKDYIQINTFTQIQDNASQISVNDYAGQIDKIKNLFTIEKFPNAMISFLSKFLYISLSTFGLAPLGLYRTLKKIFEKNKNGDNSIFYLFIVLSALAQIGIATIYMYQPLRMYTLLYGRYHEMISIILIPLGLVELTESKGVLRKLLFVLGNNIVLALVVSWWIKIKPLEPLSQGCMMVGLASLCDLRKHSSQGFVWIACIVSCIVTIGIFLIFLLKKNEIQKYLLMLIMLIEIALAVRVSSMFWDPYARAVYRDTYIVSEILSLIEENNDREVVYIKNDTRSMADILCFMLRDITIDVIDRAEEETLRENTIVVLDYADSDRDAIQKKYDKVVAYGHFVLLFNTEE